MTTTTQDGSAVAGGPAQPVYIQNQQMPQAQSAPASSATAANQVTGNMSLASIDGKLVASPATSTLQTTGNASLAAIAAEVGPFTAPVSGELAGSVTAVQLPSVPCKLVRFRGRATNAGNVYLGTSGSVTIPDGTTDTTTGFSITPGADTGWIPVDNLSRLWRICDNAADALTYIALA